MRFVQRILAMAFYAAIGVSAAGAIGGAFIALFGGMFGLEEVRSVGGKVAGLGAIAVCALVFSPLGEAISYMSDGNAEKPGENAN